MFDEQTPDRLHTNICRAPVAQMHQQMKSLKFTEKKHTQNIETKTSNLTKLLYVYFTWLPPLPLLFATLAILANVVVVAVFSFCWFNFVRCSLHVCICRSVIREQNYY